MQEQFAQLIANYGEWRANAPLEDAEGEEGEEEGEERARDDKPPPYVEYRMP